MMPSAQPSDFILSVKHSLSARCFGLRPTSTVRSATAPHQNDFDDTMHKVNTNKMPELTWSSPKGKYAGAGKEISEELGRKPESTDLNQRHPFDVEISRIPPGKINCPYHSHSAQWEFYHVISGTGIVRHKD